MVTPIITEAIVDMFCIEVPKGTTLYKGDDKQTFDMSRHAPLWLTRTKPKCKKMFEFTTNRKLKLINITSQLFRMHFLDQVDFDSSENTGIIEQFAGLHSHKAVSKMSQFYGKYVDGYIRLPEEVCIFDVGDKAYIASLSKKDDDWKNKTQKCEDDVEMSFSIQEEVLAMGNVDDPKGPPLTLVSVQEDKKVRFC